MKNTIFKTMVALLLTLAATACTDDMPVTGNPQGGDNQHPDATRITTLKNILPTSKPGYQGVDGRAYNNETDEWSENDELLLKVEIKGTEEYPVYIAYMKLVCGSENTWKIADGQYFSSYQFSSDSDVTINSNIQLVTPTEDIVLTGEEANFEAIIPEELENAEPNVELMYAPDLEWKLEDNKISMAQKSAALTDTPEYWTVMKQSDSNPANGQDEDIDALDEEEVKYVWDTKLARICIKTGKVGETITLTSTDFSPKDGYKEKGIYTATTNESGIAYFYGTIGSSETPATTGFKVNLTTVMLDNNATEATDVFVPTVLFEASPQNKVVFHPAISYKLDGTAIRNQAENDTKGAVITDDGIYKVSGVKGLLEWAYAVNVGSDGTPDPNLDLFLDADIVMPQYEIKKIDNGYGYDETPLNYAVPVTSVRGDDSNIPGTQVLKEIKDTDGKDVKAGNWFQILKDINDTAFDQSTITKYKGTIDGNKKSISGLRVVSTTEYSGFISILGSGATIKDLTFVDAIVASSNDVTGIVTGVNNGGTIDNCVVSNSAVYGAGSVGGIVGKICSEGKVISCKNTSTSVTGNSGYAGGIAGESSGSDNGDESFTTISEGRFDATDEKEGGTISGCTNNGGNVTGITNEGAGDTGGIVGINNYGGNVWGCINSGYVTNTGNTSSDRNVGGVAGLNAGLIEACGNTGNLGDGKNVGGIVGNVFSSANAGDNKPEIKGAVYGSWTRSTIEIASGSSDLQSIDGFGLITQYAIVETCKVYANESSVNGIDAMNQKISDNCPWEWKAVEGSWPILIEKKSTNN